MKENGDDSHAPKVIRWLLPKSQAAMADNDMKLRIREKLVGAAYDELMLSKEGAWRLAFIGHSNRRKLALAFVDVQQENDNRATKEQFRQKCQEYGVPLIVIVLVLSIVWDVLWYFWTHRKPELAE